MKKNLTPVQELMENAIKRGATKEELDTLMEARRLEKKYAVSPTVDKILSKLDQMDEFVKNMKVIEPFYPSEIGALLDLDRVLSCIEEYGDITIAEFYKKVGLGNELDIDDDIALEVYNIYGWSSYEFDDIKTRPCIISYTGTRGYIINTPKPRLLKKTVIPCPDGLKKGEAK
jgi:hypothetical protein